MGSPRGPSVGPPVLIIFRFCAKAKGEVIKMDNDLLNSLPMGFGMALAANAEAMESFAKLSREQKEKVLDGTKHIRSKLEMRNYVNQIAEGGMM